MPTFDNIYSLHRIFNSHRYPVSEADLCKHLECSRSTLFRAIEALRDRFGAPIENRRGRGYVYAKNGQDFELPGTWFQAEELEALLVMDHLIANLQLGVLDDRLASLRSKLTALLNGSSPKSPGTFPRERFRVLAAHSRRVPSRIFELVAQALIERLRLQFQYRRRSDGAESNRVASPQRLVYYRDHWYLDAWDECKNDLRTFALDRMKEAVIKKERAKDVASRQLDDALMGGYGLFAGPAKAHAKLVFSKERAEWVSEELWHPDQRSRFLKDGCYQLTVPYADSREILGEILRHGPHVLVKSPNSLVLEVREAVEMTLRQYENSR